MQIKLRDKDIRLGRYGVEIEFYNADHGKIVQGLTEAGIACETEGYNHFSRPHWKIVSDASVRGVNSGELVSPILEGEDGIEQIKKVCAVLGACKAKVNTSCGLHVHHDARGFEKKHLVNVLKFYHRSEKYLDSILPASRRGDNNTYCKSVKLAIDQIDASGIHERSLSRYFKVNLTSFFRHGTVEFRHHSGTVEADKIINWVVLTAVIMSRAQDSVRSSSPYKNWSDFRWFLGVVGSREDNESLSQVIQKLASYMNARKKHFATA